MVTRVFRLFFRSPQVPLDEEDDMEGDKTPGEKRETRRCEACKHFLRSSDPHSLCFLCRPCNPSQPCEIDLDWTDGQWAEVEAKRSEKAAKKASQTQPAPAWAKFVEEAITRAMEGMTSRIAVIEHEIHGEKQQVRYGLFSVSFACFSRDFHM